MLSFQSNQILSNSYLKDRLIKANLLLSLALNFAIWLGLFLAGRNFSGEIPLHYNIYFGIDLYGYWHQIFVMPVLGLAVMAANNFLGLCFFNRQKLLSYFLAAASVFCQIILALASIFIVYINF